jgi:hypothetical protein
VDTVKFWVSISTKVFAPVINNSSFTIILVAKIILGLKASIIEVKNIFLHRLSTEEIYMNILEGIDEDKDHYLQ